MFVQRRRVPRACICHEWLKGRHEHHLGHLWFAVAVNYLQLPSESSTLLTDPNR